MSKDKKKKNRRFRESSDFHDLQQSVGCFLGFLFFIVEAVAAVIIFSSLP